MTGARQSDSTPGGMKFPVDAQLPRRLANWLKAAGHGAIHTLELPAGNATTDACITALSEPTRDALIVHE